MLEKDLLRQVLERIFSKLTAAMHYETELNVSNFWFKSKFGLVSQWNKTCRKEHLDCGGVQFLTSGVRNFLLLFLVAVCIAAFGNWFVSH